MLVAKQVADFITATRAAIGFGLVWLGITQRTDGLRFAIWLLLFDWAGDAIDGSLARRSSRQYRTWIGDHDLEVDMVVSAGLLIYMLAAGYINVWVSVFYFALWTLVFWRLGIPRSLGMLFQAPIYGWFIIVSLQYAPDSGRWLLIYIFSIVIITWPRFPKEVVPGFLLGFQHILTRDRRDQ
jgi:cardiolipin synthase